MNKILKKEIEILKENFKPIRHDKVIVACWIISSFIILFSLVFLFAKTREIGFEIPVKYSSYSKIVGHWYDLFKMPGLGIAILLVNGVLATKYYNSERLISYMLAGVVLVASFMLLIQSFLFIYLLGVR